MANRRVTHVYRDVDGDILALANPGSSWRKRRLSWAIQDILENRHTYFVEDSDGNQDEIEVVNGPTRQYLRTSGDSTTTNNLDNLEEGPEDPWEIVLDDAEILAVHAALLPSTKSNLYVLILGGDEHDKSNADSGQIQNTRLYNIKTNEIELTGNTTADVFCCEHSFLPDGSLLIGGGTEQWNDPPEINDEPNPEGQADQHFDRHGQPRNHWSGAKECDILRLNKFEFERAADMLPEPDRQLGGGRWYPTLVTLANGHVLAVGGHPNLFDGRHATWLPEIYTPNNNSWRYANGHWLYVNWNDVHEDVELPDGQTRPAGENNYIYYPRMYVVPNSKVFMVSPNDGNCGFYDPETGLIDQELLLPKPPHDEKTYLETNHTAILLPLLPGDNYRTSLLFSGYEGIHRITLDIDDPDNLPDWKLAGVRDWPEGEVPFRRHGCATLLPTGEVAFTGGINHDNRNLPEDAPGSPDGATGLEAEIYTPPINWDEHRYDLNENHETSSENSETWQTTPHARVVRNYHSIALLMPNGLVFTAGSNFNSASGGDDKKEYRIEIYSPWYDGHPDRPLLSSAPEEIGYGENFTISTPHAADIARVALLRCGTVTHAWDGDQRYVGLNFSQVGNSGTLSVTSPPNGGVAPPGPYMLWIIDKTGRPCHQARFVVLN